MSSKWNGTTVVDGVAEVVDEEVDSRGEMEVTGPCHWTGTFRNPCFWILIGVAATIGFQYVMRRTNK